MADEGAIAAIAGGLAADVKGVLTAAFRYAFMNYRFGAVVHQTRTTNFAASWVTGTTAPVANQEFTIAHGRGVAPVVVIPVLPLDAIGAQLVTLSVSRAADATRLYLTSPSTSVAVAFLVE